MNEQNINQISVIMKKLFYLLLALPLVFAACEPDTPEQDVEKEAVLTLTSDAEMNFEAEGGEGVITYTAEWKDVTRNSPVPEPVVEATCEAQWVENLTVAENITFTVLANEADARETKVVVTYGDKSFEVAVKQAAKQNDQPEPPTGVNIEAKYLYGDYYGDEYSPGVGNYYMKLSDLGITEDGYAYAGGSYYYVDLYGPLFEGEGDITLPVGTYTFDANDSCAEWTIGAAYSVYIAFDENGNSLAGEDGAPYTDATLVVTESGVTLTATIDGVEHTVTFEGVADITDYRTDTGEVVEVTANYAYANYYGDQYTPGTADNFYFFFSDLGVDENGWELPNATYYRFDLYTEIIDTTNGIYIPEGTYVYDWFDTMQAGTFSDINSAYYVMDDSGWDYLDNSSLGDGSITFTESGVRAEVLVNGATHIITYEGDIIYNGKTYENVLCGFPGAIMALAEAQDASTGVMTGQHVVDSGYDITYKAMSYAGIAIVDGVQSTYWNEPMSFPVTMTRKSEAAMQRAAVPAVVKHDLKAKKTALVMRMNRQER